MIKRFTSEILKPNSLPLLDPSSWNSLTSLLPLFFNRSWGTAGFCWRKLAASAPTWVKIVALFYSKKPKWTFDILGKELCLTVFQCDPTSTYRSLFKVFIKFCFIFILFWDIFLGIIQNLDDLRGGAIGSVQSAGGNCDPGSWFRMMSRGTAKFYETRLGSIKNVLKIWKKEKKKKSTFFEVGKFRIFT